MSLAAVCKCDCGIDLDSLRDDDMAFLMGMNTKELHKLCGKLREDRFLAVYV